MDGRTHEKAENIMRPPASQVGVVEEHNYDMIRYDTTVCI